jgi:hypothetical protein
VSELSNRAAIKGPSTSFPWLTFFLAFLLGTAAGVGGVLGWQSAFPPDPQSIDTPREQSVYNSTPTSALQPMSNLAVAPMPRVAHSTASIPGTAPKSLPDPRNDALPPARAIVIDLNQPEATYTLPVSLKHGEFVIVRGRVKAFRANGMNGGAILDASGLETASVYIGGKIDGGSTLKLNAPNGVVVIAAQVTGNSRVEIIAIGGDVRFSIPTTTGNPGSQIDGGANVSLNARSVNLCGDVNGVDTQVDAIVPPGGILKVAAVRGTAAVKYSVGSGGGIAPDVTVGTVSPSATFKRRN